MEDRRVIKTKKNLKATLIEMMGEISFEQISITELCKREEISRITFYAHYSDKYALADDIFSDMLQIGTDIYRTKQEKENPGNYSNGIPAASASFAFCSTVSNAMAALLYSSSLSMFWISGVPLISV